MMEITKKLQMLDGNLFRLGVNLSEARRLSSVAYNFVKRLSNSQNRN